MPHVLITRREEQAESLKRDLETRGFRVSCLPVTSISYLLPPAEALSLHTGQWIAFTSANAVQAFAEALRNVGQPLPPSCRLAAIGKATAEACREELERDADVIAAQPTGEGLARALIAAVESQPNAARLVLHPCARKSLPEFSKRCTEAGLRVESLVIYETVPQPISALKHALRAVGPVESVIFYAPSSAQAYAAASSAPWSFAAVAIGPTTGITLAELGATRVFVAPDPSPAAVAETVARSLAPVAVEPPRSTATAAKHP